jgi:hypothetical protein
MFLHGGIRTSFQHAVAVDVRHRAERMWGTAFFTPSTWSAGVGAALTTIASFCPGVRRALLHR